MPDPDPNVKVPDPTATPDPNAKAPEPKKDETYTLSIDGENKTYTLEELKMEAQKSAGADVKFEKASKMVKDAAPGLEIARLAQELKTSKSPDLQVQKDFLHALGVSQEQIDGMLSITGDPTPPTKKEPEGTKKPEPIALEKLDPRLRSIVEEAEKAQFESIRKGISESCEKSVDNDKVLGKMVNEMSSDRQTQWLDTAKKLLNKDVERRILAREEYGPDMIASSLQSVRATLETLGVPSNVAGQPPLAGLDYTSVLGPNIHKAEPIKRVKVDDPDYEQNASERLQQLVYANMRKGGS